MPGPASRTLRSIAGALAGLGEAQPRTAPDVLRAITSQLREDGLARSAGVLQARYREQANAAGSQDRAPDIGPVIREIRASRRVTRDQWNTLAESSQIDLIGRAGLAAFGYFTGHVTAGVGTFGPGKITVFYDVRSRANGLAFAFLEAAAPSTREARALAVAWAKQNCRWPHTVRQSR